MPACFVPCFLLELDEKKRRWWRHNKLRKDFLDCWKKNAGPSGCRAIRNHKQEVTSDPLWTNAKGAFVKWIVSGPERRRPSGTWVYFIYNSQPGIEWLNHMYPRSVILDLWPLFYSTTRLFFFFLYTMYAIYSNKGRDLESREKTFFYIQIINVCDYVTTIVTDEDILVEVCFWP